MFLYLYVFNDNQHIWCGHREGEDQTGRATMETGRATMEDRLSNFSSGATIRLAVLFITVPSGFSLLVRTTI